MHGDPMLRIRDPKKHGNGTSAHLHLWLKEDTLTQLLEWKVSEGNMTMSLQGRTMGDSSKRNQWFRQFVLTVTKPAKPVLSVQLTAMPHAQSTAGSMLIEVLSDGEAVDSKLIDRGHKIPAKWLRSEYGVDTSWSTQGPDKKPALRVGVGGLGMTVFAGEAAKFRSKASAQKFEHLNLRFINPLPSSSDGFLAELGGIRPLSAASEALLAPGALGIQAPLLRPDTTVTGGDPCICSAGEFDAAEPFDGGGSAFSFEDGPESLHWPRPPECAAYPGQRMSSRKMESLPYHVKLYSAKKQLELRLLLKVGSTALPRLIDCLQPGEWVPMQHNKQIPGAKVLAIVQEPTARFASAFREVLRRAMLGRCPEGDCSDSDFYNKDALSSLQQMPWFEPAKRLCSADAGPKRRDLLQETLAFFMHAVSCNLDYYASEHLMPQMDQLNAEGGLDQSIDVFPIATLDNAGVAMNSSFFNAIGASALDPSTVTECYAGQQMTRDRSYEVHLETGPPRPWEHDGSPLSCFFPTEEEVIPAVEAAGLSEPLAIHYAQDFVCLSRAAGMEIPAFVKDHFLEERER